MKSLKSLKSNISLDRPHVDNCTHHYSVAGPIKTTWAVSIQHTFSLLSEQ